MNMDSDFLGKVMDTVNNTSKLAVNLTAKTGNPKPEEKKEENMNQPHNQTVEVKVGDQGENRKPIILKEKNETHVHHVFPENRELSANECEVRKMELEYQHERDMLELKSRIQMEEELRAERREHEEYARKEREIRRERDRKFARRLGICTGVIAVGCIGYTAYCIYTDSRRTQNNRVALGEQAAVTAEGTVQ